MDSLLLEIGTEEMPAGYIQPALDAMAVQLLRRMDEARIAHGEARTFGTPRRLAVLVDDVAPKQAAVSTEMIGPPAKVAYDAEGRLTLAAEKFAEKAGVKIGALSIRHTERGDYLVARKTERGRATRTLLQQILPEVILALPFPKTMRWGSLKIAFGRPIHNLVAMLGDRVVAFNLGGIKSGRATRGHFFMHPGKISLADARHYVDRLREAQVIVAIDERRQAVAEAVEAAARSAGGTVIDDPALLDIVTNLVEWPVASVGRFDAAFLALPREILITAMREHQKYFAVTGLDGTLQPSFIAVNNTEARDMALVASGHERVLRARLKDAQFFYAGDLEVSAETRLERLRGVLFQAELGSLYDKTLRVEALAGEVAAAAGGDERLKAQVQRAARLCKTDLVSQVVYEFPNLQGIMGRIYALEAGELPEVAAAIEEHYRPTHAGGTLPATATGAILAVADKLDSICGCFSVGLVPTGAADPYALRRQAIGLIQILLKEEMDLSLRMLVERAAAGFEAVRRLPAAEVVAQVLRFFQQRMENMLVEQGYSRDGVQAVLGAAADRVPDAWRRVAALTALKSAPDFEPIAVAFKRVVNIIRKADPAEGRHLLPQRLAVACERELYRQLQAVAQRVETCLAAGDVAAALRETAALRNPVDAFFDGVMVMDEDAAVRANRLALLRQVAALFDRFADFSKLSA
ncbi:MAG: glycine--tRNA ligase subunit beta [Deltaproteobacteria bacterium]|nr:glycine--tRNA ligase subunit beta [Deltaproteobacteria bacterium]RLB94347.1 MAG: glycine--tRNA ligase subunit beta [Deltaproteobacteria bacterium]